MLIQMLDVILLLLNAISTIPLNLLSEHFGFDPERGFPQLLLCSKRIAEGLAPLDFILFSGDKTLQKRKRVVPLLKLDDD